MATNNSNVSSDFENGHDATSPIRPPYWTFLLIVVGCCFLLLLNGQAFTNTLVFLGLAAVSGMMWIRFVVRSRQNTKQLGIYVLIAHVVVLIAFAASLPATYYRQQEFNQNVNDFIERVRQTTD